MNLFWLHTRLLIVAIIWGLGWTAGRVVATDFPPITAAWIRYIIAVATVSYTHLRAHET